MAKKRQNEWSIDEWDDSLDVNTRPKPDPFGIPGTGKAQDEWDDIPSEWQKPRKGRSSSVSRSKLLISLLASAAVIVIIAIAVLSRTGNPGENPPFVSAVSSLQSTVTITPTKAPATAGPTRTVPVTPTPTPRITSTPAPTPSPTPKPTATSAILNTSWYGPELRYYYQFLTEKEKQIFDAVYTAAVNFRSSASTGFFTPDEINHVFYVFQHDCPELFCLSFKFAYTSGRVDLDYRMDREEYNRICSSIRSRFNRISSSIPAGSDEFETQLVIYRDLIDHCDYLAAGDDSTAYADACLYAGKSQCSGYADALSLALRHFGIQSLVANSDDHAWNLVNINGQWYNCDATWDDTGTDTIRIAYDPSQDEYNAWMNQPDRIYAADSDHIPKTEPGFPIPRATSLDDSYVKRKASYIPPGKTNVAGSINSILKQAEKTGKQYVLIMLDDQSYVNNWESVRDKLYYTYENYSWSFYPPAKDHRCVYAVKVK